MVTSIPGITHVLVTVVAVSLLTGCDEIPWRSRDLHPIEVGCDPITFVVSLNDDDDNDDDTRDFQQPVDRATEDNLLEFRFNLANAAEVFIGEPVIIASRQTAVGVRVRAYAGDKTTPFDFTRNHTVPVVLYLEGIRASQREKDIGFEYQYFDADGATLCGPGAQGTVVETATDLSGIDEDNPKLLALGRIGVSATRNPGVPSNFAWSFDGSGAFDRSNVARTRFTAGKIWTPDGDRDNQLIRCTLTFPASAPCAIEISRPLNITAPRALHTSQTGALPATPSGISTRTIVNAAQSRRQTFPLFSWTVNYTIRDQFGDAITESQRGSADIMAREDVPVRSALPAGVADLDAWLNAQIPRHTSADWRNQNDGRINDSLRLAPPVSTIVELQQGRLRLLPRAANQDVVTMAGHDWHLTVNRDADLTKQVTHNTLRVHVTAFRPDPPGEAVELESNYTVVLVP